MAVCEHLKRQQLHANNSDGKQLNLLRYPGLPLTQGSSAEDARLEMCFSFFPLWLQLAPERLCILTPLEGELEQEISSEMAAGGNKSGAHK